MRLAGRMRCTIAVAAAIVSSCLCGMTVEQPDAPPVATEAQVRAAMRPIGTLARVDVDAAGAVDGADAATTSATAGTAARPASATRGSDEPAHASAHASSLTSALPSTKTAITPAGKALCAVLVARYVKAYQYGCDEPNPYLRPADPIVRSR